jgi:toxin ParE1/3/4
MLFRVEISETFEHDAEEVIEWLASQYAGDTGLQWFERLRESIESLSRSPLRCPLAAENRGSPFEIRQLIYGRKPHIYRILFTVESETVYVLHLRHGRREPMIS